MLQPTHRKCYREFQQALEQLCKTATSTDLEVTELRDHFHDVQQLFKSQIIPLNADDIAPDFVSRWQSLQTEIYKQMRLLDTDMMLLQASRSSATSRSRKEGVRDRINTLIQYCEALLQL
jgi:hypothetical protein